MKARLRTELPQLTLIAGMFILAAIKWPSTPERIPIHFDVAGRPDGYGGRFVGLLLFPLVVLAIYLLLRFVPRIDPGRANYARFWTTYTIIRTVVIASFAGIYVVMLRSIDVGRLDPGLLELIMGALFISLGAFSGKIRPNWFIGIRTPWTLSSKVSWTRTHRLGGWLMIVAGAVTVVLALTLPGAALLAGGGALLAAFIASTIYSYVVWRSDPNKIPPAGTFPAED